MRYCKLCLFLVCLSFYSLFIANEGVYAKPLHNLKVHFINVGQGDSMLIETPNNKTILIDGGRPEEGKKVVAYLKEQKINKIDLMIATHPDIDHIGGLPSVMKAIKTAKIIDSGKLHTTKTYARYVEQIHRQQIPVAIAKENKQINLDPAIKLNVLNAYGKKKNNNQSSIVLKLTYGEIDFLLMSDIEQKQEKELVKKYNVQADIIKVAHHGSNTSSSLPFLQQVNPQVAILTYSKQNNFGHPVNRVIDNLNKIDSHIYSTAVFGNIVIHTEGKNFYILPEKSPLNGLWEKTG